MSDFSLRRRRILQTAGLGAFLATPFARANTGAQWRLLVNEAVTGENNSFVLVSRYRPLADHLAGAAKVKEIAVEPVVNIKHFLQLAEGAAKPELVFGKSVNQLAKLVRDHGYQPVVHRADPYKAAFIVGKDSPIQSLRDTAKSTIVMPDEFAATTAVAKAELRSAGVAGAKVVHVKFQEAVAMEIKSGFGQVGVVNPTVAKKWMEEGGRVIAETQPVVNWSLLAAPSVPGATVAKLREAMLTLSPQQAALLAPVGVKAWAEASKQEYLDLLAYTKE